MNRVPVTATLRATIATAMRETRRPVGAIAAETGVTPGTIHSWNRRHGWRPITPRVVTTLDPTRWKAVRRAAVARLYALPGLDIGDLALALNVRRERAETLFSACGLTGRSLGATPGAASPDTDPGRLRAALRAQIARQIARFDAALSGDDPKPFDSARVLRDLGGLKRLLAESDGTARGRVGARRRGAAQDASTRTGLDGGAGDGAETGGESGPAGDCGDLPALRAEIARRAEALCGAGPDAGPAGEPAPAPDPGAGG